MDLAQALMLVLIFPVVSVLLVVLTTLEMRLFGEPGQGRQGRAAADGHVQPPLTSSSRATDAPAPDLDGVGREQPSPPRASGVPAVPQHELPSLTCSASLAHRRGRRTLTFGNPRPLRQRRVKRRPERDAPPGSAVSANRVDTPS
jgi:hypothetical protein